MNGYAVARVFGEEGHQLVQATHGSRFQIGPSAREEHIAERQYQPMIRALCISHRSLRGCGALRPDWHDRTAHHQDECNGRHYQRPATIHFDVLCRVHCLFSQPWRKQKGNARLR